jgi:hypothetical protein
LAAQPHARVSRILGHARITITLDTYTRLLEDARHACGFDSQPRERARATGGTTD